MLYNEGSEETKKYPIDQDESVISIQDCIMIADNDDDRISCSSISVINGSLLRDSTQEYLEICIIRFCDLGLIVDERDRIEIG